MSIYIIEELLKKYENNDFIIQLINNKIKNLPKIVEEANFIHLEKKLKFELLKKEQNLFINIFLSENNYSYLSSQNKYYEYNGLNYFCINEDDIIIKILSSLSKNNILSCWKYKTKSLIIKKIKEKNLLDSIPDNKTIQNIIDFLHPFLFTSENEAKYFLVILGNILLKNNTPYYLIQGDRKKVIHIINNFINRIMGSSFLYKYFFTKINSIRIKSDYRLLKINKINIDLLKVNMKNISLDLICVASFYSKLYNLPDHFLEKCDDDILKKYSFLLKDNTEENIIIDFINKNIEQSDSQTISWNNIHYIWKRYLDKNNYPFLLTSFQLKEILKTKITYKEETDLFEGTSKYLPCIDNFLYFWNNKIEESDSTLDINEFVQIYKYWNGKNNYNYPIKEKNILKIISHFYPLVNLDKQYIYNIKCKIWNKNEEIDKVMDMFIIEFKEDVKNNKIVLPFLISLYDIYQYYMIHLVDLHKEIDIIINKKYFVQYLFNKYNMDIKYNKFLSGQLFIEE